MSKKSDDVMGIILVLGAISGFLWSLFKYPVVTIVVVNLITLVFFPNNFETILGLSIIIGLIYFFWNKNGKQTKLVPQNTLISSEYINRISDKNLNLFDRNKDIINRDLENITLSSSRYKYYHIDNITRDCINEICIAEGRDDIKPNHEYLSNWKKHVNEEWLELAEKISDLFSNREKELKEAEKIYEERKQNEKLNKLLDNYKELINQFNEIAYRKVTTIDDYGEENWDVLSKEADVLTTKIAKKEGVSDDEIKEWKKYSFREPKEYTEFKGKLITFFKGYYESRKKEVIKKEDTSKMSGIEFENHLASLLKENGFTNITGTPKTGDQGADLIAKKDEKTIIIQAKRYEGSVGNKAVQEVIGAIRFYNGDEGWVITNSTFTKSARELAHKNDIKLIDGNDLERFHKII